MALGDIVRVHNFGDDSGNKNIKTSNNEASRLALSFAPYYAISYSEENLLTSSEEMVIPEEETKRRLILFFLPHILLLISITLFLFYFTLVNTILSDKVLPFIRLENEIVSFKTESNLEKEYAYLLNNSGQKKLIFNIDGKDIEINKKDLGLSIDANDIVSYGKGSNLKNIANGLIGIVTQKNFALNIDINTDPVIVQLPIHISTKDNVSIKNGVLENCNNNTYDLIIDSSKLRKHIAESIIDGDKKINIVTANYIKDTKNKELYAYCTNYNESSAELTKLLIELQPENTPLVEDMFIPKVKNKKLAWEIKDDNVLTNLLANYSIKTQATINQGNYEIVNGNIYMYDWYADGKVLNVSKTFTAIQNWLPNTSKVLSFDYDVIEPDAKSLNLPIIDFTQVMGVGKTRMHLIYDNGIGQAQNVINGLIEINDKVVMPGEEFSFFNAVNPQGPSNAYTAGGRMIGMGICTSVTTLFRSVLETGLPVTQRENHAEYVRKYQWNPIGDPSGLDLMDATFYAAPGSVIDFRFVNDFDYPIIIRSIIEEPGDGYQYHTVEIRSNSQAQKREVTLQNWTISDWASPVRFNSSFDRIVKAGGELLFQDHYFSDYQWGY